MRELITQYCQLQSSVDSRAITSCELLLRIKTVLGEGWAINVCIDQRIRSLVIIMQIQGLFSMLGVLQYGDRTWPAEAAVDGVVLAHCGKLEPLIPQGNLLPALVSHSLFVFNNSVAGFKFCHPTVLVDISSGQTSGFSQFGPVVFLAHSPSEFVFLYLTMVRSGKRHHSGERRETSRHPPVALAVETAPSPVHETGPSVGSASKPKPNSAFQTAHFKFQSNLHRPLITTHITLIISEEENVVSPLACIVPDPSPGNENSSDDDSMGNWEKGKEEQEAMLIIPPPTVDPAPVDENRNPEAEEHVIVIQDNNTSGSDSRKREDVVQPEKTENDPTMEK